MADNNCVVCFKNFRIYSVGECDHPVCYECSTRMRVLCRQKECPICRHEMSMVVFTEKVRPFRRLKRRYTLFDTQHCIAFESPFIEEMYYTLLQHNCNKCPKRPIFDSFESLNEHMRRSHDLFCCDLCADNLKIFPSERRYYTKAELSHHRRIGDVDDRSHRGHPLCEFCNVRYMDRDELYRHLRKLHLYCHICDSEGIQQFYGEYDMLRDHYRKDHFLCEEGNCREEQLTSVFPTEIDLKAHIALVHCKNLRNKQAVKQARTLELEFTLAPRNRRPVNHEHQEKISPSQGSQSNDAPLENIVASWDQEFPSLTNDAPYLPTGAKVIRQRSNRLAFDEQNFPALGSEANIRVNFVDNRPTSASVTSANISVQMKSKKPHDRHRSEPMLAIAGPSTSTSLSLTWVKKAKEKKPPPDKSSQPTTNNASESVPKPPSLSRKDFPRLQTTAEGKAVVVESPKKNKKSSVAIHMDAYETERLRASSGDTSYAKPKKAAAPPDAKPAGESQPTRKDDKTPCFLLNASRKKMKTKPETYTVLNGNAIGAPCASAGPAKSVVVARAQVPAAAPPERSKAVVRDSSAAVAANRPSNVVDRLSCDRSAGGDTKIKKSKSNEKSCDGRAPVLLPSPPKDAEKKSGKGKENVASNAKADEKRYSQSNGAAPSKKERAGGSVRGQAAPKSAAGAETPSPAVRKKTELNIGQLYESCDDDDARSERAVKKPPPGLDKPRLPVPPPGISPVCGPAAVAEPTTDAWFAYQQPQNFDSRNAELIRRITDTLPKGGGEALNELKSTSLLFREGLLPAAAFYEYCRTRFKDEDFDDIFTELIVLLPNIKKQQELLSIHASATSTSKLLSRIDCCRICFQILLREDLAHHSRQHLMNANFSLQQCAVDSK